MAVAGIKLDGDKATIRKLEKMGAVIYHKVVKSATGFAMTPVAKAAKAKAPVLNDPDSPLIKGLLKESITKKTKNYPRVGAVHTVVGPERNKYRRIITEGGASGKTKYQNPDKYVHLVEYGTAHSRPQSFLRLAFDSNRGAMQRRFRDKLRKGVIKYGKKK